MMEYLKGILTSSTPTKTVVEAGGIGYRLHIPLGNYGKLPEVGSQVLLFISTVIREDSHKQYGFLTEEERDFFEILTEVSGIGPKTALALLGHLDAEQLQYAIAQSDITGICKVPGIGKKTAERLIVEMRDRIQKAGIGKTAQTARLGGARGNESDALSALINLGYQPVHAQKAVRSGLEELGPEAELSRLITFALKKL